MASVKRLKTESKCETRMETITKEASLVYSLAIFSFFSYIILHAI
jgi:hypothetical protein